MPLFGQYEAIAKGCSQLRFRRNSVFPLFHRRDQEVSVLRVSGSRCHEAPDLERQEWDGDPAHRNHAIKVDDRLECVIRLLEDATSTHDWTEDILDSFAATAPASGVVVDASRAKARKAEDPPPAIAPALVSWGEFMLDLVHHRFLAYGRVHEYGTLEYWRAAYAPNREPEMLLALESEAGKQGNRPGNMAAVLEDASKLVSLAARLKVVVFGSNDLEERRNMQSIAKLMQAQDYTNQRSGAERPTWLWLDLPWSVWTPARGPNGWVGTAGSNDVEELDLQ